MVSNIKDKTKVKFKISLDWDETEGCYADLEFTGDEIREETQEKMFECLKKVWAACRMGYIHHNDSYHYGRGINSKV